MCSRTKLNTMELPGTVGSASNKCVYFSCCACHSILLQVIANWPLLIGHNRTVHFYAALILQSWAIYVPVPVPETKGTDDDTRTD